MLVGVLGVLGGDGRFRSGRFTPPFCFCESLLTVDGIVLGFDLSGEMSPDLVAFGSSLFLIVLCLISSSLGGWEAKISLEFLCKFSDALTRERAMIGGFMRFGRGDNNNPLKSLVPGVFLW